MLGIYILKVRYTIYYKQLITEHGYQLKDIFNMDETGLFYGYVSYCSLNFKY